VQRRPVGKLAMANTSRVGTPSKLSTLFEDAHNASTLVTEGEGLVRVLERVAGDSGETPAGLFTQFFRACRRPYAVEND